MEDCLFEIDVAIENTYQLPTVDFWHPPVAMLCRRDRIIVLYVEQKTASKMKGVIQHRSNFFPVGFLPAEVSDLLAPLIDAGVKLDVEVVDFNEADKRMNVCIKTSDEKFNHLNLMEATFSFAEFQVYLRREQQRRMLAMQSRS